MSCKWVLSTPLQTKRRPCFLLKHPDTDAHCIAILFRSTGVGGCCKSPEFCGGSSCYTPTSFRKSGLWQSEDRPWRGTSQKNSPLKPIALRWSKSPLASLESVSTGVWCVPGFGAGFEIGLEPSKLQKEGENPGKGHFFFLRQTLVCTKPWFKRDLTSVQRRQSTLASHSAGPCGTNTTPTNANRAI